MVILCDTIRLPEFDKLPDTTESAEEQKTNPRKIPATTEGADKKTNPQKLKYRTSGPYPIEKVHTNGTITIQLNVDTSEQINIRRVKPYKE